MAGTYVIYPPAPSSLVGAAPSINSTTATGPIVVFQNNGVTDGFVDAGGRYVPSFTAGRYSLFGEDDFAGINQGTYTAGGAGFTLAGNGVGDGLTAPEMHPGYYKYSGAATGSNSIQNRSTIVIAKTAGRTVTWNGVFCAKVLSTAVDRYVGYVGPFDNATTPFNGAYFKYSDNVNSGNWVLAVAESGSETVTNTSTVVDTGWHDLTIILTEANATYTYFIDGINVGTVVATTLSAGTKYDLSALGINVNRTVSSAATVTAWFLDYYNFYMPGIVR